MEYAVETPTSLCRFGVARRDITPPVGIYHRMWGAATHDRSEGVHRPLMATAMALQPYEGDEGRQILIALDHCLLLPAEMAQLVQRISTWSGIDPDELLVTFSHTHAAGLMESARAGLPGGDLVAPYLHEVAERAASAVRESVDSIHPVTVTYVTGRCSLAAHRDLWDEPNGAYMCGFNPIGPADDTLLVARITSDEANRDDVVATIVNYACHPTTLAWDNRLISPDYVGAMREVVEQATGAPCVFLQGASGDLGPRDGFVGEVAVADRNGRQLGYAAMAALESAPPPQTRFCYGGPVVSGATIGTWRHELLNDQTLASKRLWRCERSTVELPYRTNLPTREDTRAELERWTNAERLAVESRDETSVQDARAMAERSRRLLARVSSLPPGKTYPFPVTLWQIGDSIWLAVEGEPYNVLQRALRERFPTTPIVVMALAGGWRPGYLPTADIYGKGIYQESIAILAPGCLETLIEAAGRRIEEWLE